MCAATFRKLRHDATAQILVDAAEAVLVDKGLEKVTMRDIAAKAGCAPGTIYLYFKTKKEVIGAIAARHSSVLLDRVSLVLDKEGVAPLEQLREVTFTLVEYFSLHRAIIRILQSGGVVGVSSLPEEWQGRWVEFMARELELIRAAQLAGSLRRDFSAESILQFRAMVIAGFNGDAWGEAFPATPEMQAQMVWNILSGGVCGKGEVS